LLTYVPTGKKFMWWINKLNLLPRCPNVPSAGSPTLAVLGGTGSICSNSSPCSTGPVVPPARYAERAAEELDGLRGERGQILAD
jgi:hypothetical protein